jgi:UDPglucose 6-dehydrogenase
MKNPKIAIVGLGMVGGALAKVFKDPIVYDPPKGMCSVEELNKADIVFIAVPTPTNHNGKCDTILVEASVSLLTGSKIVVIKSTVVPGTTQKLQDKYPQHKFLFNPEFLTEETADQDIKYPDRQIVGYTKQSYSVAGDIMMMLPLAPNEMIMPSTEAEMIKYFANCWFATKVIYANQMYDLCQKLGINYDLVKEGSAYDKRIGRSHLEIFHKGSRGYGGKCLPKDVKAIIGLSNSVGANLSLLKAADKCNDEDLRPNK